MVGRVTSRIFPMRAADLEIGFDLGTARERPTKTSPTSSLSTVTQ